MKTTWEALKLHIIKNQLLTDKKETWIAFWYTCENCDMNDTMTDNKALKQMIGISIWPKFGNW